jgi:hypothetical protein
MSVDANTAAPGRRDSQLRARTWLLVVPLLLISMTLGIFQLDWDGFWYDEWWSLFNSGAAFFSEPLSPAGIWERLIASDPWQTPGYPLLLSAWGNLVGWSEFATRLSSLLASLLSIALLYRFTRTLTRDPLAAWCAAGVLAGSTWTIYFSHELRVYTVYLFFCILFLYSYLLLARQRRPAQHLLLALSGTLMLYMHPFGWPLYGTVSLWHLSRLLRPAAQRGWWSAAVALAVPVLLFLPWLTILLNMVGEARRIERSPVTAMLFVDLIERILYVFSNGSTMFLALLGVGSIIGRKRSAAMVWALLAVLLPATLVAYALTSLNEPRYAFAVLPLLALIAGLGMAALHRRRIPAALLLALWLLPALFVLRDPEMGKLLQNTYPQPSRDMARQLLPYLTPDAGLLNYLGQGAKPEQQATIMVHYLGRTDIAALEMETSVTLETFIARFDAAVADEQRLWLLYSPLFEGQEYALVQYLLRDRGFALCREIASDEMMEISAYARLNGDAPQMRFGTETTVYLTHLVQHDGKLLVWMGIQSNAPADTYSLGLHLLNPQGVLVAQEDVGLPAPGESCRLFALPVGELAPGDYTVNAVVYDWRSGTRLPRIDDEGAHDDLLPLATARID